MPNLKVKPLGQTSELPGRSLSIVTRRGVYRETPLYSLNSRDTTYMPERYLESIEISIQVNIAKQYSKLRNMSFDEKTNYFLTVIERKLPEEFSGLRAVIPVIVGGKQEVPVTQEELSNIIGSLYTAIAKMSSKGLIDFSCLPILYGKLVKKHQKELIISSLDATSTVTSSDILAPLISWEADPMEILGIGKLLDKYSVLMDNIVCIDFAGSNPIKRVAGYRDILAVLNYLEQQQKGTIILRYGVNVQYSRVKRKRVEEPARDLMSYYLGLDMIGPNHKPVWVSSKPPEKQEKLKTKILLRARYSYTNIDYAQKHYNDILRKEYQGLVGKSVLTQMSKINEDIEEYIKRQVTSNLITEVQKAIRNLLKGKGYQHYDSPIKYLRSKQIILENKEIVKVIQTFTRQKKLTEYL